MDARFQLPLHLANHKTRVTQNVNKLLLHLLAGRYVRSAICHKSLVGLQSLCARTGILPI
jgi:hypothetical protein